MITKADIENFLSHHAPSTGQVERIKRIREAGIEYGTVILDNTYESADQSAAIRHLRECNMTAIASIVLENTRRPSRRYE